VRVKKIYIVLAAAGVLALTACSTSGDSGSSGGSSGGSSPIKIGFVSPLSGAYGSEGQEELRGMQLGLAAAGGKIGKHPVTIVTADASTADQATAGVDKLVSLDHVNIITGTYTTPLSQAGSQEAAKLNIPWIETSAITDSLTTRGLQNYIRTGATATNFAEASASFVISGLGSHVSKKSVYVDAENGPYGTAVSAVQTSQLEAAGWDVKHGSHSAAATDVTDSVLAAKATNPSVWLLTGYNPDLTLLLRTAEAQNFKPQAIVLTGAGDAPSVFKAVGADSIAGVFVVAYSSLIESPKYAPGMATYYKAYKSKYNTEPLGTVSATAYTGITAVLAILKKADGKTDVASVRAAAEAVDIPKGGLPNGWGLQLNGDAQNQRIQLTTVQWRSDGTLPAVWPAAAVAKGQTLEFNKK
jgi:branched-chain amino acid transport system substrate-binding protein